MDQHVFRSLNSNGVRLDDLSDMTDFGRNVLSWIQPCPAVGEALAVSRISSSSANPQAIAPKHPCNITSTSNDRLVSCTKNGSVDLYGQVTQRKGHDLDVIAEVLLV